MSEQATVSGSTVEVVVGDLTEEQVDAIVNAANKELRHGGGVAGAIARAGGPSIQEESTAWVEQHGPLDDGEAAVTTAGELPASHVIHTAGPVHEEGSDHNESRLRAAVRAALDAASDIGARTIALPAISAGIYGYPPEEATAVIASEVVDFLESNDALELVRLVALDDTTAQHFRDGLRTAVEG